MPIKEFYRSADVPSSTSISNEPSPKDCRVLTRTTKSFNQLSTSYRVQPISRAAQNHPIPCLSSAPVVEGRHSDSKRPDSRTWGSSNCSRRLCDPPLQSSGMERCATKPPNMGSFLIKRKVDMAAASVPCPPLSRAGQQLGELDSRNLFGRTLDVIRLVSPRVIMIENVPGLLDAKFQEF